MNKKENVEKIFIKKLFLYFSTKKIKIPAIKIDNTWYVEGKTKARLALEEADVRRKKEK